MIKIFNTIFENDSYDLHEIKNIEPGAWVHLEDPEKHELDLVAQDLNIPMDFLKAALDEEESARLEKEDGVTLVIFDIPVIQPEGISFLYNTIPLGIIICEHNFVTVCLEDTSIIEDFYLRGVKGFDTNKKTRFMYQILYKTSAKYLQYLRQIDKATTQVENALHKSMKNRELVQMLKLEKSLVFFSTALKSNEIILERMFKTNFIKRYPDDTELLEDVIIENTQAIEMCTIYRNIISGTMSTFASIISNNLNMVMKLLASITIIIAIPTLFASFWGMNVPVPFTGSNFGFWIVLGVACIFTALVTFILAKKDML